MLNFLVNSSDLPDLVAANKRGGTHPMKTPLGGKDRSQELVWVQRFGRRGQRGAEVG
jgi:hypothetical protein